MHGESASRFPSVGGAAPEWSSTELDVACSLCSDQGASAPGMGRRGLDQASARPAACQWLDFSFAKGRITTCANRGAQRPSRTCLAITGCAFSMLVTAPTAPCREGCPRGALAGFIPIVFVAEMPPAVGGCLPADQVLTDFLGSGAGTHHSVHMHWRRVVPTSGRHGRSGCSAPGQSP